VDDGLATLKSSHQKSNANEANEIDSLLSEAASIMNNADAYLPAETAVEALA